MTGGGDALRALLFFAPAPCRLRQPQRSAIRGKIGAGNSESESQSIEERPSTERLASLPSGPMDSGSETAIEDGAGARGHF